MSSSEISLPEAVEVIENSEQAVTLADIQGEWTRETSQTVTFTISGNSATYTTIIDPNSGTAAAIAAGVIVLNQTLIMKDIAVDNSKENFFNYTESWVYRENQVPKLLVYDEANKATLEVTGPNSMRRCWSTFTYGTATASSGCRNYVRVQ